MSKKVKILIVAVALILLSSCSTSNVSHMGVLDFDSRTADQIKASIPSQRDIPSISAEKSCWQRLLDLANMNMRIRVLYVDYNECQTNSASIMDKQKDIPLPTANK